MFLTLTEERKNEIKIAVKPWIGRSLSDIAKTNEISIYETDLKDLDTHEWREDVIGLITKSKTNPNQYIIFVEKTMITTRKRFTIAHELGHFFLHIKDQEKPRTLIADYSSEVMFRTSNIQRSAERQQLEIEANFFAAELLMPEDKVKEIYQIVKNTEKVADFFWVSNQAMQFRLANIIDEK